MESASKTYFSIARTPVQNPWANCFLHKPITYKIWACKQEMNLCFQKNETCPTDPAPRCAVPDAPAGLFSRLHHGCVNTYFAQFSWETSPAVLTVQQAKYFFLFSIFYISPPSCIYYTTHSTPIICLQGQLDGRRTHGLCKSSVTSILHKLCFYINIWAFLVRL